jgi:hypothetical protein
MTARRKQADRSQVSPQGAQPLARTAITAPAPAPRLGPSLIAAKGGSLPILLILLGGAALRVFRLGAGSLWYDETVSVYLAGSPVAELLRHTAGDIHPPGYYLLLRGWLILAGYPTGHADPRGHGLEYASAFFSFFFGILIIALVYALAARLLARGAGLLAAGLVAASPFQLWYSQEVRMYTFGAALGAVTIYALWRATESREPGQRCAVCIWWATYAVAAALGLYTLYYFVFLLIPLNLWALARIWANRDGNAHPGQALRWLAVANLLALLLYGPWLPVAWRQATVPPVPPWRTALALGEALRTSWEALVAGQSTPGWLWPSVLIFVPLYGLGLACSGPGQASCQSPARHSALPAWENEGMGARFVRAAGSAAGLLFLATFGSLALILGVSAVTPLFNVRYVFTYSPAFYVPLAAGLGWLWARWKPVALTCWAAWLVAAAATNQAYWTDPAYVKDDHRAAVASLEAQWRPGDVVLVNAGYAYTALATYWQGAIAFRGRLTGSLPAPRTDAALVMVTTGSIGGSASLGWGDPRSDFFPVPAGTAQSRVGELFQRFSRVWQYRIYDTVTDPQGLERAALEGHGQMFANEVYPGDAFLRLQGFTSRAGASLAPGADVLAAGALEMSFSPITLTAPSGVTVYPAVQWLATRPLTRTLATSVRLVGADGTIWSQPPDQRPMGPLFGSEHWPTGIWQRQPLALPIPEGTPPGTYGIRLVPYDAASGQTFPMVGGLADQGDAKDTGLLLGQVEVTLPDPPPALRPPLARFGPLALLAATSPAEAVAPGDSVPVQVLWQAVVAPGEPYVTVLQLLDGQGHVVAGLESEPLDGSYPVERWAAQAILRDQLALVVPKALAPGNYRLILGLYRAADRRRLTTRAGFFGASDHFQIKTIRVS